jgi:hypothetical protein
MVPGRDFIQINGQRQPVPRHNFIQLGLHRVPVPPQNYIQRGLYRFLVGQPTAGEEDRDTQVTPAVDRSNFPQEVQGLIYGTSRAAMGGEGGEW